MTPAERAALLEARQLGHAHPHVTGIDFGEARRGGVRSGKLAVRFHVAKKRPMRELDAAHALPRTVAGYATDVIESRPRRHTASPRGSFDPLMAGISVGNSERQSTGTLGAFVRDRSTGEVAILSCFHVLAGATTALPGEPIVQPGPLHAGDRLARRVAALSRYVSLGSGYDAALATLEVAYRPLALGLSGPPVGLAAPTIGQRVQKTGAASTVTHACIDAIEGSYRIDYGDLGDTDRWMAGLHLVTDDEAPDAEVAREGDSGAVWVERGSRAAIALHFAGEDDLGPGKSYALAHPIAAVLDALGVDLV